MKRTLRAGPFVFRDPVLLCGVLYGLLWFDASGFLRIGLWAAFLHECGHVAAYLAMLHEMPTLEVNMTGFCMRTRGTALMPQRTFWLAALWLVVTGLFGWALLFFGIGFFILIIGFLVLGVWIAYRIGYGWLRLGRHEALPL